MNKKVSTLLTVALTLGGSLLSSSAFATDVTPAEFVAAMGEFGADDQWVLNIEDLPEGVMTDGKIELTDNVDLITLGTAPGGSGKIQAGSKHGMAGQNLPFVVIKNVPANGLVITSKEGVKTFKGRLVIADENVEVSNINFDASATGVPQDGGFWLNTSISVLADNVTIKNNTFTGTGSTVKNSVNAIALYPQTENATYENIVGNKFVGLNNTANEVYASSAIKLVRRGSQYMFTFAQKCPALNTLTNLGVNGKNTVYAKNVDVYSLISKQDNENSTGNDIDLAVVNSGEYTDVILSNNPGTIKEVVKNSQNQSQILVKDAKASDIVSALSGEDLSGKNLAIVAGGELVNVIIGDGCPTNDYPCVTVDGVKYLSSAQLNNINRGSFSLGYQFDDDHKATENPFGRELKAFRLEGNASMIVYLATSWPESLNNKSVISKEEFNECDFLVATPTTDENKYWNISGHSEFGESVYFESVKGDRIGYNYEVDDYKSKKFAFENAQFKAVKDGKEGYIFSMPKIWGLNEDKDDVISSNGPVTIALISNGKDRIVTTTFETEDSEDGKLCVHASIGNTRTVVAKDFLSTEKASVFNIKFVSKKIKNDATKSEYNKYLTVYAGETLAHGSDFTNLNAPESQWIVVDVTDDGEFVFQNREDANVTFTAELLSTDKDNEYEIRSADDLENYAYVNESGEYKREGGRTLNGMTVELTAVTPNKEAGYASTELDNAGLVRFVFNRNAEDNVNLSDFYVTANDKNEIEVDKDETKAAQFSVVKFAASSTATALADSIYADSDYVILKEAGKNDTKLVEDGDTIAVVSYAFKQLRADGKNYYLNADMQLTKCDDEADAPRFLVKLYKNGSYGLLSVDRTSWNRGDYFREILEENSDILTLDNNAAIEGSTSVYYDYTTSHLFDFNILKETPGTSYNHVPQHVTMEAVNGGYIAMNAENKEGIVAPVSTLKAEYTKEDLTFWLDTTDSEAVTPSFMISKAGNYMYNAVDSLNAYNDGTASAEKAEDFGMKVNNVEYAKAIFQTADLTKVGDIENYKFQIVQSADNADEYVIKSLNGYKYVAAHNQKLYFTSKSEDALKVIVTRVEAPTSNENVSATEVKVIANNGSINVKNAAGKNVVVSTILGQVVANEVLTSDNATINVPAGIVVVAVEGESFKVNVK
ncbi:MAG: DUF6383 domain-containing protein [Parabacteroides sp.]|nr:DUF6383 domain-containing protein [Parabacteroides sp.]